MTVVSTTVGSAPAVVDGVVVAALSVPEVPSVVSAGSVLGALVDTGDAGSTVMGAPAVWDAVCGGVVSDAAVCDALVAGDVRPNVDVVLRVDAQEAVTATDKATANTAAATLLDLTSPDCQDDGDRVYARSVGRGAATSTLEGYLGR